MGLAVGYMILTVVSAPFVYLIAGRLVNLTLMDMVGNLAKIFVCAGFMATAIYFSRMVIPFAYHLSGWPFGLVGRASLLDSLAPASRRRLSGGRRSWSRAAARLDGRALKCHAENVNLLK